MKKINLAVIDDDEMFVLAIKKLLNRIEFTERTVYFENGKVALNYFDECINKTDLIPEFVFLDLNMPVTNGWQFLKEFRKLKTKIDKEITIYMISNTINEEEIKRAKEIEEVTEFVCKPLTMQTLKSLLRNMN